MFLLALGREVINLACGWTPTPATAHCLSTIRVHCVVFASRRPFYLFQIIPFAHGYLILPIDNFPICGKIHVIIIY